MSVGDAFAHSLSGFAKTKGVVMGSATVELPDPLQSAGPAEAKSADDLLAQMAGDEIDRLLAESDSEPEPGAAPVTAAEVTDTSTASSPEAGVHDIGESAANKIAAPETSANIDLDAVLETAVADHSASAERAALRAAVAPVTAPVKQPPQIELGDPIRPLPLFLRPLEWISAPLDPWPDQFREILGKIGLMTLINALAVLAYVLLFRRHHH
jgi:hypothetical protein